MPKLTLRPRARKMSLSHPIESAEPIAQAERISRLDVAVIGPGLPFLTIEALPVVTVRVVPTL